MDLFAIMELARQSDRNMIEWLQNRGLLKRQVCMSSLFHHTCVLTPIWHCGIRMCGLKSKYSKQNVYGDLDSA